jgi:hypothetical protein
MTPRHALSTALTPHHSETASPDDRPILIHNLTKMIFGKVVLTRE